MIAEDVEAITVVDQSVTNAADSRATMTTTVAAAAQIAVAGRSVMSAAGS